MPHKAKPTPASPAIQSGTPLQIFKPGRHTAMSGQSLAFSEADLQATVAAYDPAKHEAPIVVGHPKTDLPAYGWVQSLAFSDGAIDATPAQVNTDFADMVAAGAFKKISAAFYSPDAPGNPVPGVYYLRHVGFLGAQPPSVKGLRAPSFADAEEGIVTFSEWDDMTNAGLWRSLREWLLVKFGAAEADKVVPGYSVADLERSAQKELNKEQAEAAASSPSAVPAPPTAFSDPHHSLKKDTPTMTPEQLKAENDRLKAQIAKAEADKAHAANVAFCESIPANKLLPAWRGMAVATLDHFSAQPATLEFGEGDAKAPLADKFKEFLKKLPDAVTFGEVATNGAAPAAAVNPLVADAEARSKS